MVASNTSKSAKDGTGTAYDQAMAAEATSTRTASKTYLGSPSTEGLIEPLKTGDPVTALSSGAITNPTSLLTRPSGAVSSSVTATSASPAVFTWTGNPLVNGQGVILGGTTAPGGFTLGVIYFAVAVSGDTFQLAATPGGTAINSTSTGTAVTARLTYAPNSVIASHKDGTLATVPFFTIPTAAGGFEIARVRLLTNVPSGWGGKNISVNLWSAAPTYAAAAGDAQPYAASGHANWLANFIVGLTQFVGGASGAGPLTGGNAAAIKLASGTSVFWDPSMPPGSNADPIASQTFTLVAEPRN